MIKQKVKEILNGKLTAEENIAGFIDKIKKEDEDINSVLHVNENAVSDAMAIDKRIAKGEKVGKLAGMGVIIKSNINVLGLICNCASKTLENYIATYDASVVLKLKSEGAIILGMANMDEFACGASGETSAFGVCKNPAVMDRIPGGSSSGSAAAVAAGFCDFAIGSDTGGSIRNPASHCGVVGFKPSYGSISRFGLIDLSMSLDQIGPLGVSVSDCKIVYDVIRGKDVSDSTSRDFDIAGKDPKKDKIKIGVLKVDASDEICEVVLAKVDEVCKANGWNKGDVVLEYSDLGIQTYYPIVYTEFFSGTRKFDGRKYGLKIEDSCGEEVLRRILGGSEITKAEHGGMYYRRALVAKKLIEKEFSDSFKKYDVIVCPTVPKLPHKLGDKLSVEENYMYDSLTTLANLAEIPGISVPGCFVEDLGEEVPVGIQLFASKGNDSFLLDVAKKF